MFQTKYLLIFVIAITIIIGCSPKTSELVVANVGETPIKLGEYEKFFVKNLGNYENAKKSTQKDREDFLNLLLKYKLKLKDASDKNLLSDPEIIDELEEYRSSLASTFLIEKELVEPALKKLYQRQMEEIRASHILIRLEQTTSPPDTLAAYNKAMEVIGRIIKGEDFGKVAMETSEDPSVGQNHGDIYYFTSGQLVTQFEDAVYNMKVGEISQKPVRTVFGYHIIKVTDRKPATGSIRVRHIMARFTTSKPDSADSAAAYARILAVQDSLKNGGDFSSLAEKKSEDPGSAKESGDLGYFTRRRWVQPFDEAAFKLKVNQISDIISTPYGFHLIKCEDIKSLQSYEELKPELQRNFQSQRYNETYNEYVSKLKTEYNYSFDEAVFEEFLSHLDSTKTTSDTTWYSGVPTEVKNMTIIKLTQHDIKVAKVIDLINKRQDFRGIPLEKLELMKPLTRIGEIYLLEEKSKNLNSKYPEFKDLMQEYQDGVVLYKAEQVEIWDKLNVSDSALHVFYDNNLEKFQIPDRVDYNEIFVGSDSLAQEISKMLQSGADFTELAGTYNEDADLKSKKDANGFTDVGNNELAKIAWSMEIGSISTPILTEKGGYSIIKVIAKEPARQKSYEEAGAEVSTTFQEYEQKRLEKEWLERVKSKYPVKQFPEVLQKAFTK
ncbi:MAG: peptidylprolyl isomerase [Bacteroidetes bacterium]|nr:peptidylprolyl isomerase [Bacteroidota bacterium]